MEERLEIEEVRQSLRLVHNNEMIARFFELARDQETICIPRSCESLPDECLANDSRLTRITFENGLLKRISKNAFNGCTNLKEIEIPATVVEIGDNSFRCSGLARVRFASGSVLKKIGDFAFSECQELREIEIPASVEDIGDGCFKFEPGSPKKRSPKLSSLLHRVTFQKGSVLKRIGKEAFRGCASLTGIEIPASVELIDTLCFSGSSLSRVTFASQSSLKRLGKAAFMGCRRLSEIEIPASVEEICEGCFKCELELFSGRYYNTPAGLWKVTFQSGSSLKRIGVDAFDGCEDLTEVEIPASVEYIDDRCFSHIPISRLTFARGSVLKCIGAGAFNGCNLNELEIPASVEQIGDHCFKHSINTFSDFSDEDSEEDELGFVSHIRFAKGSVLKRIGREAFSGWGNLTEIEIPASVEEIGVAAFEACEILTLGFSEESKFFTVSEPLILNNHGNPVCLFRVVLELEIPSCVKEIGEGCFSSTFLSRVKFASGSVVKKIGDYGFGFCKSLKEIDIPASIEEIGEKCFSECCNLSRVRFASGSVLKRIGEGAFQYCSVLTEIEIPASVEEIGNSCFSLKSKRWSLFDQDNTINHRSLCSVTFASGSTLKRIGKWAFRDCRNLREINIPSTVIKIGAYAFSGCSSLSRVTFASGCLIKRLGNRTFEGCCLNDIEIPASIETIGSRCFFCEQPQIDRVSHVTFASGSVLTHIDMRAFSGWNFTEIEIPCSVESLGESCFANCPSLSRVTFADGSRLKLIGKWAFSHCKNLTEMEIPASVEKIDTGAFRESKIYAEFLGRESALLPNHS